MNEDKYVKEDSDIVYSDLVPYLDQPVINLKIESYPFEVKPFKFPVISKTPITKMQDYFSDQELFNEFSEWTKKKSGSDRYFNRLDFFNHKYADEFIHEKIVEIYKMNKVKGKMNVFKALFSAINRVEFYKKLKELNDGTCKG